MVNNDSQKIMTAIHDLIIETRMMVGNRKSYEDIYKFLDDVEYLPALVIMASDETETFKNYLKMICEDFNCMRIYNKYCDILP